MVHYPHAKITHPTADHLRVPRTYNCLRTFAESYVWLIWGSEPHERVFCKMLPRTPHRTGAGYGVTASPSCGAAVFRHACWMDLEGIVSKRIGSRYVSGRTRAG